MRIYFVRHGESQANLLHEISNRGLRHGLTPEGRRQAEALARCLQASRVTRIYSSPLLRAIETSVILAHRLGVEYEITDALREYDCGILEGRSDAEAWQSWQELFEAWVVRQEWERRIEGGESFHDIRSRFEPFVAGLATLDGDSNTGIVCVSHGGVYWMMLPLVLVNVSREFMARCGIGYTTCVVTERRAAGLLCVEWNGQPVESASGS